MGELLALAATKKLGMSDSIAHVIGPEGHRFYADIAWDALKRML